MKFVKNTVQSQLMISACVLGMTCAPAYGLEALSDQELSKQSAQAIGIYPEDFSIQFNAEPGTNQGSSQGAGYVRLIPVGPNPYDPSREHALGTQFNKADVYLYGLSLSQSNKELGENRDIVSSLGNGNLIDNDLVSRFGRNINSWGSAQNPFSISVNEEQNVPNFSGGIEKVAKLSFAAPVFDNSIYANAGATAAERSAYNLKAGVWLDLFERNAQVPEDDPNQFLNRMRLNLVWDGLSINGSNFEFFQSLAGSSNSAYNNAFSIGGLIRLNSGDGQNLRAQITDNTTSLTPVTLYAGVDLDNPDFWQAQEDVNLYQERMRWSSGNTSWTPYINSVLSIGSAQLFSSDSTLLTTPALGGFNPTAFDPTSGLKLYNVNLNLPLSQSYQPLLINTSSTSDQNFSIELARIPNVQGIFQRKYQRFTQNNYEVYSGPGSASSPEGARVYFGSTCNFYQCGNDLGGLVVPATYGSISIGSTNYQQSGNLLYAATGQDAYGVSFGSLSSQNRTFGTNIFNARIDGFDYRRRYRIAEDNPQDADANTEGDWNYYTASGAQTAAEAEEGSWTNNGTNPVWIPYGQSAAQTGIAADALTPKGDRYIYSSVNVIPKVTSLGPDNNLGSVAIDGINIHHMEFTSSGLR